MTKRQVGRYVPINNFHVMSHVFGPTIRFLSRRYSCSSPLDNEEVEDDEVDDDDGRGTVL